MKVLLDTNVFLWCLAAEERLNRRAKEILTSRETELFFSAASSWEIAIKSAIGTLKLPESPAQFVPRAMRTLGVRSLEITHVHALEVAALPPHHRDPFDRLLIAQAQLESLILLTADKSLQEYDVELILAAL